LDLIFFYKIARQHFGTCTEGGGLRPATHLNSKFFFWKIFISKVTKNKIVSLEDYTTKTIN